MAHFPTTIFGSIYHDRGQIYTKMILHAEVIHKHKMKTIYFKGEKMKQAINKKSLAVIAPANELIKKPFLNEFEVAAITGRAVSTLRNDRHLRRGLPYLKISKRSIRYRTPDVMNFMLARPITFDEVSG